MVADNNSEAVDTTATTRISRASAACRRFRRNLQIESAIGRLTEACGALRRHLVALGISILDKANLPKMKATITPADKMNSSKTLCTSRITLAIEAGRQSISEQAQGVGRDEGILGQATVFLSENKKNPVMRPGFCIKVCPARITAFRFRRRVQRKPCWRQRESCWR